ncbi:uncharacterized protein LOC143513838 [Brachyhypopomus gauderio]|uniref:uncharacterized protein LOC143513838 n=1 Tax=Brachyhypopomus gauderio TaxID=698409 RepID=UPI00404210ED
MKTLLLLFVTVIVVTALPTYKQLEDDRKAQRYILREIIQSVNILEKNILMQKIVIQEAVTTDHCTTEDFCRAGKVLENVKAQDLGLTDAKWLLPRRLVAYSRNIQCTAPTSNDTVDLHKLMKNIKRCAQIEYSKDS